MAEPAVDPRMAGLSRAQVDTMHAAARAIRDGQAADAERLLHGVLDAVPEHGEALRLLGILYLRLGRHDAAHDALSRAVTRHGEDPLVLSDLAQALAARGDIDAALATWRRACEAAPDAPIPWFNLGRNLQLHGSTAEAIVALERACALAPELLPASILLGDALAHMGRFDAAAARYRAVLRLHPAAGDAWRGLSNIKTRPLSDADADALVMLLARRDIADSDRIAMGYALGKLEEDRGRHPQAFAALSAANGAMRRLKPWSLQAFESFVRDALQATASLPPPADPELGREAIFIVGLPRSGSTLFEQILATHPQVEGTGELPDLGLIVQAESQRRRQPYPQWSAQASAADWRRLGEDYLARTRRWRARKPRFVDKMPENWKHAGILRAMLPGATVIDVRRDPVETGWSCFKQQFYQLPHFACDLGDIGAYLRGCERAMDAWRARAPDRIHPFRYERLVEAPEDILRALLAACALDYDPACLRFHEHARSVRTASAAQVRQPLRRAESRAGRYGPLLDPLRAALAGDGRPVG